MDSTSLRRPLDSILFYWHFFVRIFEISQYSYKHILIFDFPAHLLCHVAGDGLIEFIEHALYFSVFDDSASNRFIPIAMFINQF